MWRSAGAKPEPVDATDRALYDAKRAGQNCVRGGSVDPTDTARFACEDVKAPENRRLASDGNQNR